MIDEEWPPDPDGMPARDAARVILLDRDNRVLLFEGSDPDDAAHRWWFTTGGGIMAGESAARGAARELFEETGLRVEPDALSGPIAYRVEEFHFNRATRRQREHYFAHRIDGDFRPHSGGWTPLERDTLLGHRWWSAAELRASGRTYYPAALPDLLDELAGGLDLPLRTIS